MGITKKGSKNPMDCYKKLNSVNELFFKEMPKYDIRLCIQLLSPTEAKFSAKWMEGKGKSFDDLNR